MTGMRAIARRWGGPAALLATVFALSACAKKAPPSGGPPDLTPPTVVASTPDSGAAGVPRDVTPSITFSEFMDPRATAAAVDIAPRVEIRRMRWKRHTLIIDLADTLQADQTYTLFVGTGARDRHGNALVDGATITFSTADTFPRGALEGELLARGMTAAGIYLWCYREGREPDSTARDFDAIALADRDGRFHVAGLEVPGAYRLWAFADLNRNRSFEPRSDVLAAVDTVLRLTPAAPAARGLLIEVVNPNAPARVQGAVLDSLADSVGVIRVIAVSESDSTERLLADATREGFFELSLDAGPWRIRAFRDLDKNRRWNVEEEPASEEKRLELGPADIVQDVQLVLRRVPAAADTVNTDRDEAPPDSGPEDDAP